MVSFKKLYRETKLLRPKGIMLDSNYEPKMLHRKNLDMLYTIIVRSVIDYALLVYADHLKQTEILRLEHLQYKASKLAEGAFHFTSKERLNLELGLETVNTRIKFLGLSLFHKIYL